MKDFISLCGVVCAGLKQRCGFYIFQETFFFFLQQQQFCECVCGLAGVTLECGRLKRWLGVNVRSHILSTSTWWTIIIHYCWLSALHLPSLSPTSASTLVSLLPTPSSTCLPFLDVLQWSAWSCHSVSPPSAYRFADLCPTMDKCLHANFSAFSRTFLPFRLLCSSDLFLSTK